MKAFNVDTAEIILLGDSGNCIGWDQVSLQGDMTARFWVMIESDWYKARIEVETTAEQLVRFHGELGQLSRLEITELTFYAGDGAFELSLKREKRGNIWVSGLVSKNLIEDAKLAYAFESHLAEIDMFANALGKLLNTWQSD